MDLVAMRRARLGECTNSSAQMRARPRLGDHLARVAHLVAVGAVERHVDLGSAVAVLELQGWTLAIGEIAIAPLRHRDHDRVEREALIGRVVLVTGPLPWVLVRLLAENPVLDQETQPGQRAPVWGSRCAPACHRSAGSR